MLTHTIVVAIALVIGAPTAFAQRGALSVSRFVLMLDGQEIASFTEMEEASSQARLAEGSAGSTRSRGVLKLRRPASHRMELWAWHEAVLNGDIAAARKSVSLVALNGRGDPVLRYHLEHAWPSQIEIGSLKAGSSEVLMETVTIVSERIQRVSV